jgi:dihydrolipoamide dehydrogenase
MYDLAIIGGGPAGYSAALEAIKYGLSVVLFERELIGGTCLNRGCVPTKFLAHVAELYDNANNSARYGICHSGTIDLDFNATQQEMNDTVSKLRDGLAQLLEKNNVEIINGEAIIQDIGVIRCKGILYEATDILIATGSTQAKPIVENAVSSDDILKMDKIPDSALIIGGGVVAVEFAYILNKLGCRTTIMIRGERILRKWDKELAISVSSILKKSGIDILTKCTEEDYCRCDYEVVLSVAGRIPQRIGMEKISVTVDDNDAIYIDNQGRTSMPHIYAAGDVVSGSLMLAHAAMEQGRNVARIIANKRTSSSVVAECIYISPEVASVGMTEAAAKEEGIDVVTGKVNMVSNARTLIETDNRSFIKIVVDKITHEIIGAQLMCRRASDIASEFVVVINNKITVEKLKESVHPHPSFSEAIFDVLDVLDSKLNGI